MKTKVEIRYDAEFHRLIPDPTIEEHAQLEKNLKADGCREPLTGWFEQRLLIDGYQRKPICDEFDIPYDVIWLKFKSREDVIAWIIDNQLGRRNVSLEMRAYLLGLKYNAAKRKDAGHGAKAGSENQAVKVAEAHGVSESTVKRAGEHAENVDKVREKTGADIRQAKPSESAVLAAAAENPDNKSVFESIREGREKPSEAAAKVGPQGKRKPVKLRQVNDEEAAAAKLLAKMEIREHVNPIILQADLKIWHALTTEGPLGMYLDSIRKKLEAAVAKCKGTPLQRHIEHFLALAAPEKWKCCVKCRGSGVVHQDTKLSFKGEGQQHRCEPCEGYGYTIIE